MTVEIKQLVIRAIAEPSRPEDAAVARVDPPPPLDREALVAECVREVLRTLERRRGRR